MVVLSDLVKLTPDHYWRRLEEHAKAKRGGCVVCGAGPCLTRADAIYHLIEAGQWPAKTA